MEKEGGNGVEMGYLIRTDTYRNITVKDRK